MVSKDVPITSPIFINGPVMSWSPAFTKVQEICSAKSLHLSGEVERVVFTQQVGSLRSEADDCLYELQALFLGITVLLKISLLHLSLLLTSTSYL